MNVWILALRGWTAMFTLGVTPALRRSVGWRRTCIVWKYIIGPVFFFWRALRRVHYVHLSASGGIRTPLATSSVACVALHTASRQYEYLRSRYDTLFYILLSIRLERRIDSSASHRNTHTYSGAHKPNKVTLKEVGSVSNSRWMAYVIYYWAVNQMAVEEEYISGLVRCLKVNVVGLV